MSDHAEYGCDIGFDAGYQCGEDESAQRIATIEQRIATIEQQNVELGAALEKIAAMDYRKSAVNLFGRVAHEIVNAALSKVKQT